MALGLPDVLVGTWTAPGSVSGCTVVLPPDGTVGSVAVRGAAPGTREAVALGPTGKVQVCHAVVLSGGSAYGLASADGVMAWLEERGRGYPVAGRVVPIVGAAILLDGSLHQPSARPGQDAGRAACDAASVDDPSEGGVGAGAGCTVAKVGGFEGAWASGQGIAVRRAGGVTVGALVANNALGEVIGDDGTWVARARVPDDAPRYPTDISVLEVPPDGPASNTVLACVVTDARLRKSDVHRVADMAHSGVAQAVRPAHTTADGDAVFALATGRVEAHVDLVAHLAAEAVAEATRRAVTSARGRNGLPGLADAAAVDDTGVSATDASER